MNSRLLHASLIITTFVSFVLVACRASSPTQEQSGASALSAAVRNDVDGGDDECPADALQCVRACAGTGPLAPALEKYIQCVGCGSKAREKDAGDDGDQACEDLFLKACEP